MLVFASLAAAVTIGVPLGMVAARQRWLEQPVLVAAGLIQTVPSLALLAFLIPLTGAIGVVPALIALFLYALLPITRNTHAGLTQVPVGLVQAGTALGLTARQIMRHVELPLALPLTFAGIRTAAVFIVATATLGGIVGGGGLGDIIVNQSSYFLRGVIAGAIAVTALAFAADFALWGVQRAVTPAPLRRRQRREPELGTVVPVAEQ